MVRILRNVNLLELESVSLDFDRFIFCLNFSENFDIVVFFSLVDPVATSDWSKPDCPFKTFSVLSSCSSVRLLFWFVLFVPFCSVFCVRVPNFSLKRR